MTTQYCPHIEKCLFYRNFVQQKEDRRIDVIVTEGVGLGMRYGCLTLIALDDPETGIPMSEELKIRLHGKKTFDCSHLTLLNRTIDLERNLNECLEMIMSDLVKH